MQHTDHRQEFELVLLDLGAQLVESQDHPFELFLGDGVLESAQKGTPLEQVEAGGLEGFLFIGATVAK